jgi:ABC-2 type transport system ATP-binding protein
VSPTAPPAAAADTVTPSGVSADAVAPHGDIDPAGPALELAGLTKVFGEKKALDSVSLTVPQGSVFGFLGPNGAGKTTALRILAGLAHPTSGTARIFGRDVRTAGNQVRALLGYLPDVPGFYPWMNARRFLQFSGELFGLSGEVLDERVQGLLELADLADVNDRIRGYSRGMRQRLGLAQALINAPRLLLLDEPTSALDPIGRKEVLDMVASLGGRTTVFFSTHILGDVERVCDMVAILNRGKVVIQAPIEDLKTRHGGHRVAVDVGDGADRLAQALSGASWLKTLERGENGLLLLTVSNVEEAHRGIPAAVVALDLGLKRLETEEASLEDVFVELVEGAAA